jgi:hypothetical protein
MERIDYSQDYWLKAHGACALCFLFIALLFVFPISGLAFAFFSIAGIVSSIVGMGSARYGHSRIPFVLWLIPFTLAGALVLFGLSVSH